MGRKRMVELVFIIALFFSLLFLTTGIAIYALIKGSVGATVIALLLAYATYFAGFAVYEMAASYDARNPVINHGLRLW
jgi:hypothetical protein